VTTPGGRTPENKFETDIHLHYILFCNESAYRFIGALLIHGEGDYFCKVGMG